MKSCKSIGIYAGVLASFFLLATPIEGQTVHGILVNQTTGLPVTAGFVALIDEDSVAIQRALVDRNGSFSFALEGPGRFALRSMVIGLRSTTSPYFDLSVGQVFEYEFDVPALPVQLNALVVSEERVCRSRGDAGIAATTLWNEAKKALNAVLWTERQGLLRHRLIRYERLLEPVTFEVTDEGQRWTQEGLYRGSPFGSVPAEDLARNGYIRDAGSNEWIYDGPDARILLSDVFADSHCFSAREPGREEDGLIGLAFEPSVDSDLPDVSGVLWLDESTAELRFVEYRYTDPPWDIEFNDAGGRIEFEQLATGVWIVRRWWIRMPVIGLRAVQRVQIGRPLDQYYIAAVRETGAWIEAVSTLNRQQVGRMGDPLLYGSIISDSDSTAAELPEVNYRSGFRIGLNVNMLNTGSERARFTAAPAFQGALRLSTTSGLQLTAGMQFSQHGMRDTRQQYDLFQLFLEPRFSFSRPTWRLAPFLGARIGNAWEYVIDTGASFKATGLVAGGVGGATYRLDERISLEAGITLGIISFNNFKSSTDRRWNECVTEQGEVGTPMPITVSTCSPPEFWTGPQLTPGTGLTGSGHQPHVEHPDTARRDTWSGLWLGVILRLGGR